MAIEGNARTRLSALALATIITFAAGCGGGGGDSGGSTVTGGSPPPSGSSSNQIVENEVSGSVGDGPIVGSTIVVKSSSKKELERLESNSRASFTKLVKTQGNNYPLLLESTGGTDLVTGGPPDFDLSATVALPSARSTSNLNPFSTLISDAAAQTGNRGAANLAEKTEWVMERYGFGLDPALVPDPMTTPITNSNVAVMVKASETFGEMIRRTRDALAAAGSGKNGNRIMFHLASDMADGVFDGVGSGGRADPRVAAVATVASAAVLLEAFANRLHVYGVDATSAMDNAIRQTHPAAPAGATTSSVRIPADALEQAALALEATSAFTADPAIRDAIGVVRSAGSGSLPSAIGPKLPAGIHDVLARATQDMAYASDAELEAVNAVIRATAPDSYTGDAGGDDGATGSDPGPDPGDNLSGTGVATVRWTAPTRRTDGTPLDGLGGFRIRFGQSQTSLSNVITVKNPGATSYVVEGLGSGTWYFAVTAYDLKGLESSLSNLASKTFN
ncbi:MAG: fibronectin type III domain-containing protein [Gammaproteobacteria bacterium]